MHEMGQYWFTVFAPVHFGTNVINILFMLFRDALPSKNSLTSRIKTETSANDACKMLSYSRLVRTTYSRSFLLLYSPLPFLAISLIVIHLFLCLSIWETDFFVGASLVDFLQS